MAYIHLFCVRDSKVAEILHNSQQTVCHCAGCVLYRDKQQQKGERHILGFFNVTWSDPAGRRTDTIHLHEFLSCEKGMKNEIGTKKLGSHPPLAKFEHPQMEWHIVYR